jgi:hypothetical protein
MLDLLIIGGEDHKTGDVEANTQERFTKLTDWTKERFPIHDIEYRWSGQVMEPTSSMAFIGHNPNNDNDDSANNIYVSTGDSKRNDTWNYRWILLTDMILGKENHWASLYDPSRKTNEDDDDNTDKSDKSPENNNSDSSPTEDSSKGAGRGGTEEEEKHKKAY